MENKLNAIHQDRGNNGYVKFGVPEVPIDWPVQVEIGKVGTHEGARRQILTLSFENDEMINFLRETADMLESIKNEKEKIKDLGK